VLSVTRNITAPGASATVSDTLSCDQPFVELTGSSATPIVTYSWTGPNAFYTNEQNTLVSEPGTYTLQVNNLVNGCTSVATVEVTGTPDCAAIASTATTSDGAADVTAATALYPNPINDHGTIQFTAPEDGLVKIEVYTLFNVKTATLFEGPVTRGNDYTVNLEASGYHDGIYLYRISGAGISNQGRFSVSH
jgi:hypothetical protein